MFNKLGHIKHSRWRTGKHKENMKMETIRKHMQNNNILQELQNKSKKGTKNCILQNLHSLKSVSTYIYI